MARRRMGYRLTTRSQTSAVAPPRIARRSQQPGAVRDNLRPTHHPPYPSHYPALHRLEDQELLTSDWQPFAGRRRPIYAMAPAGAIALQAQRRDWRLLVSAIEAVLAPGHGTSRASAVGA